jgi:hypothetical protein
MRGSLFQIITFIESTATRGEKEVRKDIPHLPPQVEASGVDIPIGNSKVLLAALYKSAGSSYSNADIIELLSFRRKSILAGDLNAKPTYGIVHFQTPHARTSWIS